MAIRTVKPEQPDEPEALVRFPGVFPANLVALAAPTPKGEVKKRRGPGGKMLDYIDARYVMDRFDHTVGPANWQDQFTDLPNGSVRCGIGVRIDGEWVWKHDIGDQSDIEATKGAYSDAFKRAAVHWGVGRDLYDSKPAADTTNRASSPQRGSRAATGRPAQPSRAASDYKQQSDPPGWEFDGKVAKPISPEPSAPEMPHADEPAQASPAPGLADPKVQEAVFGATTPAGFIAESLAAAMDTFDTGRMSGERGTKAVIEGAVRSIEWAERSGKKYLSLVVLSSEGQDVYAVISEALASQLKLIDPKMGFSIGQGSIVGISGEWKHLPEGPTLALSGLTS